MTNKNHFINGITDLLILSILKEEDSYVYDIVKAIGEYSGGLLSISQNTVYTATYKLENEGKISEYSKLVGKKRTRVYYHIEEKGIEYLEEILDNYRKTTKAVANVFAVLADNFDGEEESENE